MELIEETQQYHTLQFLTLFQFKDLAQLFCQPIQLSLKHDNVPLTDKSYSPKTQSQTLLPAKGSLGAKLQLTRLLSLLDRARSAKHQDSQPQLGEDLFQGT